MEIGKQINSLIIHKNRIMTRSNVFRYIDELVYEKLYAIWTSNTTRVYHKVREPVAIIINTSANQIGINFKNLMNCYDNR